MADAQAPVAAAQPTQIIDGAPGAEPAPPAALRPADLAALRDVVADLLKQHIPTIDPANITALAVQAAPSVAEIVEAVDSVLKAHADRAKMDLARQPAGPMPATAADLQNQTAAISNNISSRLPTMIADGAAAANAQLGVPSTKNTMAHISVAQAVMVIAGAAAFLGHPIDTAVSLQLDHLIEGVLATGGAAWTLYKTWQSLKRRQI